MHSTQTGWPSAAVLTAAFTTCVTQAQSIPIRPDLTYASGLNGRMFQVQLFCGWLGVQVSPMTAAFADSLGMVERYGAISGQPEPNSPAAKAGIAEGDVITAINGSPLMSSNDFAAMISAMAPGSMVYLRTFRNGELIEVQAVLGSSTCPTKRHSAGA
jgi:predicted metalloprotease with PDZ domain